MKLDTPYYTQAVYTPVVSAGLEHDLFEQIPLRRMGGDKDFMADMAPWSEAYRTYEEKKQRQRQSLYRQLFPEPERPRTPRKRDRSAGIPEGNGLTA